MKAKGFKVIGVNSLVFLVLVLIFEVTAQVITLIYPSYDVLFLQPDRVVGWKHVPNLHFTWAGFNWYACDFSVNVEINSLGFRDIEREIPKPKGVKRIALLGDSLIEALQVPLEKTAGQLLEKRLNIWSNTAMGDVQRWEVLNFGVSDFGVGQYLLTLEQYARPYEADYVAIFVAKFHMIRTVNKYEDGADTESNKKRLWVRPTFRVVDDKRIREPAKDFDEFVRGQQKIIKTEFAGKISRKTKQMMTIYYASQFKDRLTGLMRRFHLLPEKITPPSIPDPDAEEKLFTVNLKIISELGQNATSEGSRLVVLDASQYFFDNETVSIALKELCSKNGFGYIPIYADLLKANRNGVSTRWAHDGHFNEAGNEILAKALFDWIAQSSWARESH